MQVGEQLQVDRAIVETIPIHVADNLLGAQVPPQRCLHYEPVLRNIPAGLLGMRRHPHQNRTILENTTA
jgi:hypothetical protein